MRSSNARQKRRAASDDRQEPASAEDPPVSPLGSAEAQGGGGAEVEGSAPAWRALSRALQRVGDTWDPTAAGELTAEQAFDALRMLGGLIAQGVAGEAEPRIREFAGIVAARRMLDAVRREFIVEAHSSGEGLTTEGLLVVLSAIERVNAAIERDAAQRFIARLSGPDALQLLVEVAHDMRSPLGSILFLAERLRKGQSGAVNPIQERQLGLVYSAAFGLSSLASDVMELARGGERLMELQPIPFSISDIFRSVHDIVLPVAEEKGLGLRLTPPAADLRLGYPAALNRVLLNLTTNALKFTAQGGVDVAAVQTSRTRVEFSVRDTGRGIPEQVLTTLFDAFRRRQRPGDYYFSSAGLGLSICQTLIRKMGGELRVETELEKGTRFFFELELPLSRRL